jgi:hypothetical protein
MRSFVGEAQDDPVPAGCHEEEPPVPEGRPRRSGDKGPYIHVVCPLLGPLVRALLRWLSLLPNVRFPLQADVWRRSYRPVSTHVGRRSPGRLTPKAGASRSGPRTPCRRKKTFAGAEIADVLRPPSARLTSDREIISAKYRIQYARRYLGGRRAMRDRTV